MAIVDPGDFFLERAEDAARASDLSFDKLDLSSLRVKSSFPIADAVTNVSCTRTVEGASTLVVTLDDKDLGLTNSGVLDLNADGRLDALVVMLDLLRWRLVKAEPALDAQTSELKLTFEEEAVALLRQHDAPFAMSRANATRAEFAHRLVREVTAYPLGFYSPEETFQQATAKTPRNRKTRDAQRKPGFADGVTLKIAGATASPDQLKEVETSLTVADEENATGRARQALAVAGIGESGFKAIMNQAGSPYGGVFQGNIRGGVFELHDTEGMARHFLLGGKGYQQGGAIQAARDHPDWSPGTIAYKVEGSRPNFASDQEAEHHYQQWIGEARAIIAAWTGDASGSPTERTVVKPYVFRRGLPGKRETSWDTLQRLASEVGWRCFVVASIVYFISEEQLFMSRARAEIGRDTPGVVGIRGDWDEGKTIAQITLNVHATAWSFPPGSIVALRDLGPFTGRWLVSRIDRPDLRDPATEITLTKPIARKREPAADTIKVSRDPAAASDPDNERNGETGKGPAHDARGVKATAAASARLRKWRNPDGSIVWVCTWMFPQLEYARHTGKWSGHITEGWRSRDTEEVYWDRYGHDPGLAARPGSSNHGWTIHPRGAIDTSDPAGLKDALSGWSDDPPAMKGAGVALPRDVVHFSSDGR